MSDSPPGFVKCPHCNAWVDKENERCQQCGNEMNAKSGEVTMKKPFFTLGALTGAAGLAGVLCGNITDGAIDFTLPMLILVIGLVLLLVGFFRGESKK